MQRQHASNILRQHDTALYLLFINLLVSACSGSMLQTSCGSMIPASIYYLLIY
jgi:hypothetical protein